jgi:hypothetical protein
MNWSALLAVLLSPLLMARTTKKTKQPAKAKPKPPTKSAKKQPARPPAVPPPAPAKVKPVITLPFDRPGKVSAPAATPIPIVPVRGERVRTATPRFGWLSVASATQYQLSWSTEANLTRSRTLVVNQTAATLPDEESLRSGTLYYWRVRAGNESGWGPWSVVQEFGTAEEVASQ